jgi:hypothetical protein
MKTGKRSVLIIAVLLSSKLYSQTPLNIIAFVEGYYADSTNAMRPLIDPANNPTLFDTITVQLADTAGCAIVYSEQVVFNINGTGTATIPTAFFNNIYYVALRHRNSLETWSAYPVVISNLPAYNFTSSIYQAAGNNMKWVTNAACMYSGDLDSDGRIDGNDYTIMNNAVQSGASGSYLITDLNGDHFADIFDYLILDQNIQAGPVAITSCMVTDVSEIVQEVNFTAYPVPAVEYINIRTNEKSDFVNIYNCSGQNMGNYHLAKGKTGIDVKGYVDGIYIIKSEEGHVFKFTVKH